MKNRGPSYGVPRADYTYGLTWRLIQETVCLYCRLLGFDPRLGRSPGGGLATHSSILAWKIPMNRGAWKATVHGVKESQTRLSDWAQHITHIFCYLVLSQCLFQLATNNIRKPNNVYEVFTPVFSTVQSLSCVWLFATPWTAACQVSLSITNSWSLLKLMFIESVMPSNHLILCRPLLLLHSIFPSIRVFASESVLHIRWQSIRVSSSVSVLPMNTQDWFPLGWTGLISLQSTELSRVFSNTTDQKHQFFSTQPSL